MFKLHQVSFKSSMSYMLVWQISRHSLLPVCLTYKEGMPLVTLYDTCWCLARFNPCIIENHTEWYWFLDNKGNTKIDNGSCLLKMQLTSSGSHFTPFHASYLYSLFIFFHFSWWSLVIHAAQLENDLLWND